MAPHSDRDEDVAPSADAPDKQALEKENADGGAEQVPPANPKERAAAAPSNAPIRIRPRETRVRTTAAPAPDQAVEPATASKPSPTPGSGTPHKPRVGAIRVDEQATRVVGLQHVALVAGMFLLLFCAFYVGKKYQYWRYVLATRNAPATTNTVADKFPGIAAEDLLEQALAAENAGDWKGAADRFVAAKYKNRAYKGLMFRVAKLFYDHGDFINADRLFQNAIELGENVDAASYHRALIATAQQKFPAAEQFLLAAANTEPLIAHYFYSLAEALRLDLRPRQAIPRYEQAIRRARTEQQRRQYQFKIRIAEIEAAGATAVAAQIAEKRNAGALSVDWLMTEAAAKIHEGKVNEALPLIAEARAGRDPEMFAACVGDVFFQKASQRDATVAAACRLDFDPRQPAFQ